MKNYLTPITEERKHKDRNGGYSTITGNGSTSRKAVMRWQSWLTYPAREGLRVSSHRIRLTHSNVYGKRSVTRNSFCVTITLYHAGSFSANGFPCVGSSVDVHWPASLGNPSLQSFVLENFVAKGRQWDFPCISKCIASKIKWTLS